MDLTAFSCNLKIGSMYDANVWPQTIRPYCRKDKNKALYKQSNASNGSKFHILRKSPHVLTNFLESSLKISYCVQHFESTFVIGESVRVSQSYQYLPQNVLQILDWCLFPAQYFHFIFELRCFLKSLSFC